MLNLQNATPNTPVKTHDGRSGVIVGIFSHNPYTNDQQPYAYVTGFWTFGACTGFSWADYFSGEQLHEAGVDHHIHQAGSPFSNRTQQLESLEYLLDTLRHYTEELTDWNLHEIEDLAVEIVHNTAFDHELVDLAEKVKRWAVGTLTERQEAREEAEREAAKDDPYFWADFYEDDTEF
jgi:hypothetical protein